MVVGQSRALPAPSALLSFVRRARLSSKLGAKRGKASPLALCVRSICCGYDGMVHRCILKEREQHGVSCLQ